MRGCGNQRGERPDVSDDRQSWREEDDIIGRCNQIRAQVEESIASSTATTPRCRPLASPRRSPCRSRLRRRGDRPTCAVADARRPRARRREARTVAVAVLAPPHRRSWTSPHAPFARRCPNLSASSISFATVTTSCDPRRAEALRPPARPAPRHSGLRVGAASPQRGWPHHGRLQTSLRCRAPHATFHCRLVDRPYRFGAPTQHDHRLVDERAVFVARGVFVGFPKHP